MRIALLVLLIFVILLFILFGVPLLCILLILKPQTPDFSLQTINVHSYKLAISSENLMVSSVFSLNLLAENPNRVGLSYDPSMFHVLSQGLVVGLIRIPRFHQPPLSKNMSIEARVSVESVDVSNILYRSSKTVDSSRGVSDGIRIMGDVIAHVRIFRVTSPKITISLDCNINVDQSRLSLSSEVYSMKWNHNHLISVPSISQSISKKCSFAVVV